MEFVEEPPTREVAFDRLCELAFLMARTRYLGEQHDIFIV